MQNFAKSNSDIWLEISQNIMSYVTEPDNRVMRMAEKWAVKNQTYSFLFSVAKRRNHFCLNGNADARMFWDWNYENTKYFIVVVLSYYIKIEFCKVPVSYLPLRSITSSFLTIC